MIGDGIRVGGGRWRHGGLVRGAIVYGGHLK